MEKYAWGVGRCIFVEDVLRFEPSHPKILHGTYENTFLGAFFNEVHLYIYKGKFSDVNVPATGNICQFQPLVKDCRGT